MSSKFLTSCRIWVDTFDKLVEGKLHVVRSYRMNHRKSSESVNQFGMAASCVVVVGSFRSRTCRHIADLRN